MNPLSHSNTGAIDSKIDVLVHKDPLVEKAVQQYAQTLPALPPFNYSAVRNYYVLLGVPILDPQQIDIALQGMLGINYESSRDPGLYVSRLIQVSHDAGHNDFMLHTRDVPLDFLCDSVKGDKDLYVNITIRGDTGKYTGNGSRWCSVRHEGSARENYFNVAKNAEIFIRGTLWEYPLSNAEDITLRTTNQDTFEYVREESLEYDNVTRSRLALVSPAGKVIRMCEIGFKESGD